MYRNKYPTNNYVPYNPDKDLSSKRFGNTLGDTLDRQKYERIINDAEYHFESSYIINFDIINHQCRGYKLKNSIKNYKTISKEKINAEINDNHLKDNFISSALACERKDVFLRKDLLSEHFNKLKLEEELEKEGVFLSSMKKRAFKKKYTDNCKSLPF